MIKHSIGTQIRSEDGKYVVYYVNESLSKGEVKMKEFDDLYEARLYFEAHTDRLLKLKETHDGRNRSN